jgi:hypothetical protein
MASNTTSSAAQHGIQVYRAGNLSLRVDHHPTGESEGSLRIYIVVNGLIVAHLAMDVLAAARILGASFTVMAEPQQSTSPMGE